MRAERTYFEDVAVGETVVTPGLTVTEAHVGLFRGLAGEPAEDPHLVPELLPLALCTGLGWRVPRPPLAVRAFLSLEWEVLAPLRVGDTLHSTSRTVARRTLRDGGVIVEAHEVRDQRGAVVQRGRFTFLVDRRPGTTRPAAYEEEDVS